MKPKPKQPIRNFLISMEEEKKHRIRNQIFKGVVIQNVNKIRTETIKILTI